MTTTPMKPDALPVSLAAIPDELKASAQWVTWQYAWRQAEQKWTKLPLSAHNLRAASTTNAKTWATYERALAAYRSMWMGARAVSVDGIGFVLTEDLGITGIDLDHCRNPDTGAIDAWAQDIVQAVHTYWEVSPSGTGLRGLSRGTLPPGRRKKGDIEMYTGGRYLTITGCHLVDTPLIIEACQDAMTALHTQVFPAPEPTMPPSTNGAGPTLADTILLDRARKARNGGKFIRLSDGDTRGYPSASEADLALCILLAFWTTEAAQIDRLVRQSQLMRPKWDEQHGEQTYGAKTIAEALRRQTEHHRERSITPHGDHRKLGDLHRSGLRTIAAGEVMSWRR